MTQKTTTSTASVGDPAAFPIVGGELAGSVIAVAVTVVGGLMWFRRKSSRDSVEIVKDRTEGRLLEKLMDDRDAKAADAKEAWAAHNELVKRNGFLEAENVHLKREVDRLMSELTRLQAEVDKVRADIWELRGGKKRGGPESGHAPLSP